MTLKKIGSVEKERGSVMMEYVILNFLFVVVIAVAGHFFLSPDGGRNGQPTYRLDVETGALEEVRGKPTVRYGFLGKAFLDRYDLMVKVVSMPYP